MINTGLSRKRISVMPLHPDHFPGPEVTTSVFPDAKSSLTTDLTRTSIRAFIKTRHKVSNSKARVQEMARTCPDLPMKVCPGYSARILKDHAVWPESLQEMKTTL